MLSCLQDKHNCELCPLPSMPFADHSPNNTCKSSRAIFYNFSKLDRRLTSSIFSVCCIVCWLIVFLYLKEHPYAVKQERLRGAATSWQCT
uniref:Uncharacterized protein n=1 Tax=Arundo donax TaxID=35708 RepID=A0A0A8YW22_ARUDO